MSGSEANAPNAVSQEFKVHACGNLYQGMENFIGKFTAGIDVFQKDKDWKLRRQPENDTIRRRASPAKKPRTMPWELLNVSGQITHTAQPEAMAGAKGLMRHFVLIKEGPNFTALPIKDWYNFRPNVRPQKVLTLEEAEQKMLTLGDIQISTNSRMGALAAKAEQEGGVVEDGDDAGEQPDSDEERENTRAARLKAAQTEAVNGGTAKAHQPPTDIQVDKGEKGEDWEHEDERADDDLEQGDDEGSDQEDAADGAKRAAPEPDSEGEDQNLTEEGKEMNRILRKTRLSSGSGSDAEANSQDADGDEEDDDGDDDLDLDDMASKIYPKVKAEREPSPSVPSSRGTDSQKYAGRDSRTATPQPSTQITSKRKATTPPLREATKKARPEDLLNGKKESKAANSTQSEATSGPPSAKEIIDFLKARGPMTASELTAKFKKRLPTQEERSQFTAHVKRLSKLEERPPGSGNKLVVLR